ncbi:MAG: hypothetical protein O7G87_19950 [bacterium]|nr:hypothetical protein [bacterium]
MRRHISGNTLATIGFIGADATDSGQRNAGAAGPVEVIVLDEDFADWGVVVEGKDGVVLGFVGDVHGSNIGVFEKKDVYFINTYTPPAP